MLTLPTAAWLKRMKKIIVLWFGRCNCHTVNFFAYNVCATWPIVDSHVPTTSRGRLLYNGFRTSNLGVSLWTCFILVHDTYVRRADVEELTYSLSTSLLFLLFWTRTVILIVKRNTFEECVVRLNNDFSLDTIGKNQIDSRIFDAGEHKLRKISILFYFLVSTSLFIRALCHLVPAEKSLMIPHALYTSPPTPIWELLFFIQTVGMAHFLAVIIIQEMVILGFILRILDHFEIIEAKIARVGNLYDGFGRAGEDEACDGSLLMSSRNPAEVLKKWLSTRNSEDRSKTTDKLLKEIVIHHQQILDLVRTLNSLLDGSFFLQLFGVGLLLAILFADIIWKYENYSAKMISQAISAGTFLADLTFLCILGSRLETRSHRAANALYSIPWLQMSGKNRKTLFFLLMALWRHPTLSAGKVMFVNLTSYVKLLRMIYNSIAFMQNVKV